MYHCSFIGGRVKIELFLHWNNVTLSVMLFREGRRCIYFPNENKILVEFVPFRFDLNPRGLHLFILLLKIKSITSEIGGMRHTFS